MSLCAFSATTPSTKPRVHCGNQMCASSKPSVMGQALLLGQGSSPPKRSDAANRSPLGQGCRRRERSERKQPGPQRQKRRDAVESRCLRPTWRPRRGTGGGAQRRSARAAGIAATGHASRAHAALLDPRASAGSPPRTANTPNPNTKNGMAENFVAIATPVARPKNTLFRHPALPSQHCAAYSASVVAAAGTSRVASAACPRTGGTLASNSTANSASPSESVSRRAHSQVANNNSARKRQRPQPGKCQVEIVVAAGVGRISIPSCVPSGGGVPNDRAPARYGPNAMSARTIGGCSVVVFVLSPVEELDTGGEMFGLIQVFE